MAHSGRSLATIVNAMVMASVWTVLANVFRIGQASSACTSLKTMPHKAAWIQTVEDMAAAMLASAVAMMAGVAQRVRSRPCAPLGATLQVALAKMACANATLDGVAHHATSACVPINVGGMALVKMVTASAQMVGRVMNVQCESRPLDLLLPHGRFLV